MAKKYLVSLAILMLMYTSAKAQLSESFDDGDFTASPYWTGDTSSFIIDSSEQLQSNNTTANNSFYLATENKLSANTEWNFWMRLAFNPSSANCVDTYLTSSASNFSDSVNTGYFVRAGNTDDEVSLYRRDRNGILTKIIDGEDGVLNHSNNIFKIKVTCDSLSKWTLYFDPSGSGNSYVKEGIVSDSIYKTSSWFGFLIKQSTSSFFQKHYFDNIEIKKFVADVLPPKILSVTAVTNNKVDIIFDEPIKNSSNIFSNYSANNGLGMPTITEIDSQNSSLVHLTFENPFTNDYTYTLTVSGIQDLSGNEINNATSTFTLYEAEQYDVIIDEIFADPTPQVGLPTYEWIELKNMSPFPINLKGWKLGDASKTSAPFPELKLQPDSFVIITSTSAQEALSAFGRATAITGFPSLNNDGDLIFLANEKGSIIHAVRYSSDWYGDELKKDGGWSLEMIDTKTPCTGENNWTSSKDNKWRHSGKNQFC